MSPSLCAQCLRALTLHEALLVFRHSLQGLQMPSQPLASSHTASPAPRVRDGSLAMLGIEQKTGTMFFLSLPFNKGQKQFKDVEHKI